jgi:hypothetical protein
MRFSILDEIPLESVPSASGIVVSGSLRYLIGDDSPFLHELDAQLRPIRKFRIFEGTGRGESRVPKPLKPDLEAMELINGNEIAIFGSGLRSPFRDVFVHVCLGATVTSRVYAIGEFYDRLRDMDVLQGSELNIEAAAFHSGRMMLFNRRKNVVFQFDTARFLDNVNGKGVIPEVSAAEVQLPTLNGVFAGFSGAAVHEASHRIIVTASVENSPNAYDDGEVGGSFIGWVDADRIMDSEAYQFVHIIGTSEDQLKVESVAVEREVSEREVDLLLTTDSDGGTSMALRGRLTW